MSETRAHPYAAAAVASTGLLVLIGLTFVTGPLTASSRVDLGQVSPLVLDTLSFENRIVRASLAGTVEMVDSDGTAWVEDGGHLFPVVSADSVGFELMSTVLVVGRLRGSERGRWLDAEAWTHVRGIPQVTAARESGAAVQKGN